MRESNCNAYYYRLLSVISERLLQTNKKRWVSPWKSGPRLYLDGPGRGGSNSPPPGTRLATHPPGVSPGGVPGRVWRNGRSPEVCGEWTLAQLSVEQTAPGTCQSSTSHTPSQQSSSRRIWCEVGHCAIARRAQNQRRSACPCVRGWTSGAWFRWRTG